MSESQSLLEDPNCWSRGMSYFEEVWISENVEVRYFRILTPRFVMEDHQPVLVNIKSPQKNIKGKGKKAPEVKP